MKKIKSKIKELKNETFALYLAYKDPRIPWWKKAYLALIIGYLFSPIDLIPDFIPILGYIDDLILVPLGILLAVKLIDKKILRECRQKAAEETNSDLPIGKKTSVIIIIIWIIGIGLMILTLFNLL